MSDEKIHLELPTNWGRVDVPEGDSFMAYVPKDELDHVLAELARHREALKKTIEKYDGVDNGKCAVCGIGRRFSNLKGGYTVCDWQECLSHEWRQAMEGDE